MKMKYTYLTSKGEMWVSPICKIIFEEKYDINYSIYLAESTYFHDNIPSMDRKLSGVKKVENGELECYKTGTELFGIDVYKNRVEFFDFESDNEYPDWSCTLEEYKRVLLGKKAFLLLPKEKESYLEIKINNLGAFYSFISRIWSRWRISVNTY